MAVHRLLRTQGARVPLLGVAGACGRVAVAEAAYKPLSAYLDQPLDVRKGLALQALRLMEGYVDEDPRWVLFTTDVHLDNLVVTNAGQVALLDMSGVMLIDRDLVDGEMEEEEVENEDDAVQGACDMKCLMDFYDGLMADEDSTGSKTNPGCLKVKDKLETMFALLCKNVLSDMDEDRRDRDSTDQRGDNGMT